MAGRVLTIGLLLLLLGAAGYAAWTGWHAVAEAEIGFHGVVALLLGIVGTLGIAGLLLWLMRFSQRRGFDQ
jgi:TRAP-type C4-dicarboxylate transport system permease small subunit